MNKFIIEKFKANLTILSVVNKKNMKKRLQQRKRLNRYDKFNDKFYKKVQNGFLKIANEKKRAYQIIDSNLSIKLNKKIIINKLNKIIK